MAEAGLCTKRPARITPSFLWFRHRSALGFPFSSVLKKVARRHFYVWNRQCHHFGNPLKSATPLLKETPPCTRVSKARSILLATSGRWDHEDQNGGTCTLLISTSTAPSPGLGHNSCSINVWLGNEWMQSLRKYAEVFSLSRDGAWLRHTWDRWGDQRQSVVSGTI